MNLNYWLTQMWNSQVNSIFEAKINKLNDMLSKDETDIILTDYPARTGYWIVNPAVYQISIDKYPS